MTIADLAGQLAGLVVVAVAAGIVVALVGLAVLGVVVQRAHARAEVRLDDMSGRILQMAVALSDQTRAEGHEARLRLIRAAHAAMNEQQRSSTQQTR